jgi:hypothetical protein
MPRPRIRRRWRSHLEQSGDELSRTRRTAELKHDWAAVRLNGEPKAKEATALTLGLDRAGDGRERLPSSHSAPQTSTGPNCEPCAQVIFAYEHARSVRQVLIRRLLLLVLGTCALTLGVHLLPIAAFMTVDRRREHIGWRTRRSAGDSLREWQRVGAVADRGWRGRRRSSIRSHVTASAPGVPAVRSRSKPCSRLLRRNDGFASEPSSGRARGCSRCRSRTCILDLRTMRGTLEEQFFWCAPRSGVDSRERDHRGRDSDLGVYSLVARSLCGSHSAGRGRQLFAHCSASRFDRQ